MYISFCSFFFKREFASLLYTDLFVVAHVNRCVPQICAIYTQYIHFKTTILGEMQNIETQQMDEKVNVNMLYDDRSTLKNVAEGKNLISNESNANLSRTWYLQKKMTTNCYCNYLKVGDAYLQLIIIVVMVIVIVIIMMRRIGLIT